MDINIKKITKIFLILGYCFYLMIWFVKSVEDYFSIYGIFFMIIRTVVFIYAFNMMKNDKRITNAFGVLIMFTVSLVAGILCIYTNRISEEDKNTIKGTWECNNCKKLNPDYAYICSCGKTKVQNAKENEEKQKAKKDDIISDYINRFKNLANDNVIDVNTKKEEVKKEDPIVNTTNNMSYNNTNTYNDIKEKKENSFSNSSINKEECIKEETKRAEPVIIEEEKRVEPVIIEEEKGDEPKVILDEKVSETFNTDSTSFNSSSSEFDTWVCPNCKKINSGFISLCSCGIGEKGKEIKGVPEGCWKCPKCGRLNKDIFSICSCGYFKNDN